MGDTLRVTTVVGARPQFVKLAPVSARVREVADERVLHTGQHYDYEMSRLFFEELEMPEPHHHLGVGSGTHGHQMGRTMVLVEEDLTSHPADLLLVFGDTNSTLGAALAASKLNVPVAHVEAGVRGFNRHEPEETNRVLTDRLSELLFVPTEEGVRNLADEGITGGVHMVGDVMVDTLAHARAQHGDGTDRVRGLGLEPGAYTLATFHRPANVDQPETLGEVVNALGGLDRPVVLPLHPRTRERLVRFDLLEELEGNDRITLIAPVGYLTMLALLLNTDLVITDSGGLQKEAYLARVPCITVSQQTAWIETVRVGWNRLVPPVADRIVDAARGFRGPPEHPDFYGDGHASERIRDVLAAFRG